MEDRTFCLNPIEGDHRCIHCQNNIEFVTEDCVVTAMHGRYTDICSIDDPVIC